MELKELQRTNKQLKRTLRSLMDENVMLKYKLCSYMLYKTY